MHVSMIQNHPDYTPYLLASRIAGSTGVGKVSYDPTGSEGRRFLGKRNSYIVEQGIVIRSGVGGYDCSVKVGMYEVPCNILVSQTSQGFGVSRGEIPVEGTVVFVLMKEGSSACGWIIGSAPRSQHLASNDSDPVSLFENYPTGGELENPYLDNSAYYIPYKGSEYTGRLWSNAERPQDIVPGDSLLINENHCGVTTTLFDVELSGGNSFVRVGRLDDEIKIRSTNFTKWTNHEALSEFNDGGYISSEGRNYSYQGELLGTKGLEGPRYELPKDTEGKEPRPRSRWWKGFLGNIFSWFTVRARETPKTDDETLVSVHGSQGGNIMVRSTGGISLEKYPKIPIPKRLVEPWDPKGDREVETTHEPFRPFKVEDPHSRGIAEASRMAWEQRTMYRRFDELKKDFEVKNEKDVNVPGDQDKDPMGSTEIEQSKYATRKAGVFIGEDGSVIIRDAWGSEITMIGGNVTISTPGNIISTANKDIVSIARNSVVIRGVRAAEMSSDEGDTRVHAKKLLTMAGGSNESPGGVLVESIGSPPAVSAPPEAGSSAFIGGVVLRSKTAGVLISGKNAYVNGEDNVFVWGGPDGSTREGNVFLNGKNTIMTGAKLVAGIVEETTYLATENFAGLLSPNSALVWGGDGAMIINGDQIPILWSGSASPPDMSGIKEIWSILQDSGIEDPYTWDNVCANAVYTFRTAVQAMTNSGIEPWEKNGTFTLYEPYWQIMHDVGDPMAIGNPYTPEPKEVYGTKCWPGKGPITDGNFVKYGDGNIEEGFSKPREALKDSVSLKIDKMSEFKV